MGRGLAWSDENRMILGLDTTSKNRAASLLDATVQQPLCTAGINNINFATELALYAAGSQPLLNALQALRVGNVGALLERGRVINWRTTLYSRCGFPRFAEVAHLPAVSIARPL